MKFENLGEMLHSVANAFPEKVALICEDRRRSYRELDIASNRVANALLAAGYTHQAHIGILGKNSEIYFELMFGIVKAGCGAVVMNWRLAMPELHAIIEDAEIRAIFFDAEFAPVVTALRPSLPQDLRYVGFDGSGQTTAEYDMFRDSGSETRPAAAVTPENDAILMYTSGTTGTPKGVQTTHFANLWAVEATFTPAGRGTADDVNLLTTPLFHLAAIGWSLGSLYSGATLVILPAFYMAAVIAAIDAHRITRAVILPALMPTLLDGAAAGADLASLRMICYGASPIPEPLLERMLDTFRCGFLQNYGMTEITGSATCLTPADHFPGSPWLQSCGRAYAGVAVSIVAADGSACMIGDTGEIMIKTPSLMRGYWHNPDATDAVVREGWYASGDMGYLDRDGYLFLRDRKKDMIISGGENIYPAEVESALTAHPDVVRAAVIGVPSEKWGEEVKAVVIRRDGSDLSEPTLIAFLRGRIGGYKIPKSIDFVTELPLTPVGKVAKPALRQLYWSGHDRQIN